MHACPRCADPMEKVIYMGLPGKLCVNDGCNTFMGPASYAAMMFFNGAMMMYQGSYWRALWHWMRGNDGN